MTVSAGVKRALVSVTGREREEGHGNGDRKVGRTDEEDFPLRTNREENEVSYARILEAISQSVHLAASHAACLTRPGTRQLLVKTVRTHPLEHGSRSHSRTPPQPPPLDVPDLVRRPRPHFRLRLGVRVRVAG